MLRENLNPIPDYTPHFPIPTPTLLSLSGTKNTSPAVQGALPCSMQLGHKQYVEEVNNALFEVDGSISWVAAGCFFKFWS